jgi:hypothetical protein
MNNIVVFDEPKLEFANGGILEHPRDGLTLFGPLDLPTQPQELSYAIIGTHSGVSAFREFAQAIARPIFTDDHLSDVLWPHFPGFEETFHAELSAEPAWVEELDTLDLKNAATERDDHKRIFEVVSIFINRMKAANVSETSARVFVVVVPDFVYTNCRAVSRFPGGHGHRISKREQRLRPLMLDFFEAYEPEQYSWSLDFRYQIKARAMDLGIPVQIVRESTLRLAGPGRRGGWRQLTPLSDRTWNLSSALYNKSGGKPWKLNSAREGVCHIGVSFKDTDVPNTVCNFAQIFGDDGDGLVALGDEGDWASPRKGEYHLSKENAARLLFSALKTLHGKKLKEIFLHSRSPMNEEEFEGYQAACPKGTKLAAIRVASERTGLRLYRGGTQPVLRGTFWPMSSKRGLLWCSGFKPRLRTHDGPEVPHPLYLDVQHGDCDLEQVARDIFALTKLNYNGCSLGENQPVTTHLSRVVGEILASHRTLRNCKPEFKYYI